MDIEHFIKEALVLARKAAAEDEVPVGAVIVRDNEIIGRGYNRREGLNNPIAHAEIIAIQEAATRMGSWRLIGCTLIVTLEPCPMCLAACQQARINEVIYCAHDSKGGAISMGYNLHSDNKTNHRFPVRFHENAECGKILTEFFREKRQN